MRNGKTRQLPHIIGASVSLLAINREIARRPAILGQMPGTPRSSVTVAAQALQKAGLISYERGRVAITNRHGLEQAACDHEDCWFRIEIPSGLSRYRNERTVTA